jgi:hypothetical protein
VKWAHSWVTEGCMPDNIPTIYLDTATAKGWLTKKEPRKPSAKGLKAAAAFLRR